MKKIIKSPFYTIADDKLFYLDKYQIAKLPLEEDIRKTILLNEGVLFNKIDIFSPEYDVIKEEKMNIKKKENMVQNANLCTHLLLAEKERYKTP